MSVEVIRADALAGVSHGFLGRRGGLSTGVHAGLNVGLGSDDEADTVAANRRLATDAVLRDATLVTVYQVHGADAVTVLAPIDEQVRPHADALVTDRPGLALGILTADCAPVLFADREARVVGAAHAGWRGAIAGVTDATLLAMETLGARRNRIAAVIGPCIAQASYEVDPAFRRRFLLATEENDRFFAPGNADHFCFDLPGFIADRLTRAGVETVARTGLDTYADADRFYSYRRATHRNEPDYGRQISLIALA